MLRRCHDCRLRWWSPALLRLVMLAGVLGSHLKAAGDDTREYQVKAVLLLNLARFVEWPASAFDSPQSPLVIGVLGRDDFGPLLDEVVRGETVGGRAIELQRYPSMEYLRSCHLLFISQSEEQRMEVTLARLEARPILTVSDTPRFTRAGGVVRLFTKPDGKLGLRINLHAARRSNLTLSALLLRVAEIVDVEDD
jgi:hypothetical protein